MTYEQAITFVLTWQRSRDIAEFCRTTGIDRRQASNDAANLRRKGVPLKPMPHKWRCFKKQISRNQYRELAELAMKENDAAEADAMRRRCSQFAKGA